MDHDNIRQLIEEKNIKWIQTHFTDLFGGLRVIHIPSDRFIKDDILNNGPGFDGSSVGLTGVEKSDLIAKPDPDTFLILPHEQQEARIIADIYDTSPKPFKMDPRYILKKAVNNANNNGFDEIKISPEMEFFVLPKDFDKEFEDYGGNNSYFNPSPLDDAKEYRKKLSDYLQKSNYNVKYHHHENGKYQHEVEIKSLESIRAADFSVYFKFLAREVANQENLKVTFIPKLMPNESGNGMHAHICLYNNGQNMFYDENDKYRLSQTARYFIGGIIKHAKGLAAISNPTVNSYKRLVPNYEAPVYIAWGEHNRSSLIRIAAKKSLDIEIRNADSAANPYLFFAGLINSGLDGIKNKKEVPPIEKNIYAMKNKEIREYGIQKLPSNLYEAVEEFENDEILRESLGKDMSEVYITKKKQEFNRFINEITDLDYEYYFDC